MLVTILLASFLAVTVMAADWEKLKTVPTDPDDAQNVRVWLGIERSNQCRTDVTIVDLSADTVRHLFSTLIGPGYYNFYWDKLDDSGQFVDTGQYRYVIDDCQGIRVGGKLRVEYKQFERFVSLGTELVPKEKQFSVKIGADSIPVSLTIENRSGRTVDTVFVDSLFMAGDYRVNWRPGERFPSGVYKARLQAADFSTLSEFRYRR